MDFNEKWEALMKEYESKLSIPNWFIDGSKTLLSRNITIEDWNKVYSYLSRMSSDNTVLLKLLEVLKTFVVSSDSKIYEDMLSLQSNLLEEINSVDDKIENAGLYINTAQQTATEALNKINEILLDSEPAYDTFKELSNAVHESDATAANILNNVATNKNNISELQQKFTDSIKVSEMSIGTSRNYEESDSQVPTTKAAYEIAKSTGGTSNSPIKTYRKELYGSDWLRIAKVKDVFKNSSGIFTINLYGNYIEKNNLAPIPNVGTLNEINIDTSKTIEEVDSVLASLTPGGNEYIICANSDGSEVLKVTSIGDYSIVYEVDIDSYPLYTSSLGWDFEFVNNGKYILPNPMTLSDNYGLENDKLVDLMWVGEYRPSHTEVLTTSVFNVSCGLNAKGKFISDVLPITQAPTLSSADSSGGAGSGAGSGEATGTYGLTAISLEKTSDDEIYVNGLFNFPATELLFNYVNVELKIENNLNFEYLDDITIKEIEDCNAIQTGTILKANTQYYVTLEGSLSELKKIGSVALEIADTSGTTEFWEPIKYTSKVDSNEWLMSFWYNGDASNTGISIYSLYFESTTLKGDMLRKQFSNDRLKVLNLVIQVLAGTVYKNGELIGSIFSVSDDDIIEIVAPNNSRAGISLYSTSTIQILTSYIDTVDRYVLDIYTYDNFIGKTIRLLATADSDYSESYDLFSIYTALKDSKKPLYKHRIVISPIFDSSSKFFLEFYNYSEEPYNHSKVIDYLNTHVASIGNTLHLDSYCPEYGHLSIEYNPYQEAVITATVYKFTEQTLKTHTYSTWNYFIDGAYDDVIPVDSVIIS